MIGSVLECVLGGIPGNIVWMYLDASGELTWEHRVMQDQNVWLSGIGRILEIVLGCVIKSIVRAYLNVKSMQWSVFGCIVECSIIYSSKHAELCPYHHNVVYVQVDRSYCWHLSNILWIPIPEVTFLWVLYYIISFFSVYLSTSRSSKYIYLPSPSPPLLSLFATILLQAFRAEIGSGDKIWMFPPPWLDSTPSSTVYPLYRFQAH